jgi:multiple sugar transport system substrate-binding protein
MPDKTTRHPATLAAMSIAAFLLTSSAALAQSTVNFLITHSDGRWASVIEAFNEQHPDITINLQVVPFADLITAIETRIGQGDSSIDLFYADTPRIAAMSARGYLLNMDDRRDAIAEAVQSDVAMSMVSAEGSVWAYPLWTTSQFLYFNRDLLSAAGIEPPSSAIEDRMTWEEVVADARAAQAAGATHGLLFEQVDRYYQLQALFESAGGGSGLTGEGNMTADITNDAWVRTARWYGDLFESGLSPRGITPGQTTDLFARGEVAYFVSGPWSIGAFEAAEGLNYGVAPHPYFEGGTPVTATGSWAVAINPAAANLEAARTFIEFATLTEEGSRLSTTLVPNVPLHHEALVEYMSRFDNLIPEIGPAMEIMAYELQNTAVPRPTSVGYIAFETEIARAIGDIRNGADAAEVLADTQARLEGLLARQR